MRKLLVALVILAVLAIGFDLLLRTWVEGRVAGHVQRVLDLEREPEVALRDRPFLLSLLRGRFSEVGLSTGPVRAAGTRLEDVSLELTNVELTLAEAFGDGVGAVRTGGGRGRAYIGAGAVNDALAGQGAPVEVHFDDGATLISSPRLPQEVEGTLALDGRRLVLRADRLPQSFDIELPRVVDGITYSDVSVEDDRALLSFSVAPGTLRPPR